MKATLEKLKIEIIEALNLELNPNEIPDDSPIFVEGLGLDSIDALELMVLLEKNYKIKIESQEEAKEIFKTIKTLAQFIYDKTK